MPDPHDAWETQLDADSTNWDLRRIYADWLEERGEVWAAVAQRWMADNEKNPWVLSDNGVAWYNYALRSEPTDRSDLPLEILELVPGARLLFVRYSGEEAKRAKFDSRRAAEAALAVALEKHLAKEAVV
jgi:hypothetical protein